MEHLSPELLSLVPLDHQQRYLRVHLQNAQHLLTQRSTEKLHCHCIFHLAAPTRITRLVSRGAHNSKPSEVRLLLVGHGAIPAEHGHHDRKSTRLNSSHTSAPPIPS